MKKRKEYNGVRLVADAIRELNKHVDSIKTKDTLDTFTVDLQDSTTWNFDNFEEFIAEYPDAIGANYQRWTPDFDILVFLFRRSSVVSVRAGTREAIQKVFNLVETFRDRSMLPPDPDAEPSKPVIFIGHGRSTQWRDLKDHLHEKHGYEVEAYETGARAGHTIRDILEEMLESSSFALLVLTGEDETKDDRKLARQNVIHEAGLFQGRLGFARAIVLLEKGTEEFSNIAGIQQIRFSKNNIKETFGEVLATLKREFGG